MRKFILDFKRAPGDALMLTALVRDLKLTYGNGIQVDVRNQFPGLWKNNPYLTPMPRGAKDVVTINFGGRTNKAADRQAIQRSGQGFHGAKHHYVTAFHHAFSDRTGIKVDVLYPHGDLHLSDFERTRPMISGRYWIIVPGGKTDMTNKWWDHQRYQDVVDKLRPWGLQFVQDGATKPQHYHPPLDGVLNLTGKTSIRELIVNIQHAEGVICGCTFQMHIAAALGKPCVVILGGREEPWFEEYSNDFNAFGPKCAQVKIPHRLLHTFGMLSCCHQRGCWLRRVAPLKDGRQFDNSICRQPVKAETGQVLPECMNLVTTSHGIEAVMWYYEHGYLPPLPQWHQQTAA